MWVDRKAVDLGALAPSSSGGERCARHRGEIVGRGLKAGDGVPHVFMLVPLTRIDALTVSPAVVNGGKTARATVTLNRPAPPGGETIFVTTSFRGASTVVPATVTVAAGQSSAAFAIATSVAKRPTAGTITAALDGQQRTTPLAVIPRP